MGKIKLVGILVVLVVLGVGIYAFVSSRQVQEPAPTEPIPPDTTPDIAVIGQSVEGRDILAYTFLPAARLRAPRGQATDAAQAGGGDKKHLLFVGGIHGGYEWNSVLLSYEFIEYLEKNSETLPDNLTVTVVPSLNPDGVFKVLGATGQFSALDAPAEALTIPGRFNANGVDLNRNFDCKWAPESMWRGNVVSAGTAPFSEPEVRALRDFVLAEDPDTVIFWHSQAGAVYASECEDGILPETLALMNTYAQAAGYPSVESFNAYPIIGDAEGWLASIGVPAITVELSTHETIEWEKNLAGVNAVLNYYKTQ